MNLSPREVDKLLLHEAATVSQKRLARGLRLNAPEATGLIASVVLEHIRDGKHTVAELMDLGRQILGTRQVLAHVADLVHVVQVEGTFPDGSKMITVHNPIASENGDLNLALYGSFLPVPDLSVFGDNPEPDVPLPGEMLIEPGEIELGAGRDTRVIEVTNTGDRPIQVGSHYMFFETNRYLKFDREQSYGYHLDIPAGTSVRFEPGETKSVNLIEISGDKRVHGGNDLGTGPVNDFYKTRALKRAKDRGFANGASASSP